MSKDDLDTRLATVATLAEPARRALYRYVVGQAEPVSRDQAAKGIGVARHVAKFHLDRLVDDGLLDVDYRRPPGRRGPGAGRPAKVYRRSSREVDVTLPERRYELAGRLLARAVIEAERDGEPVSETLRRVAADTGHELGEEARQALGPRPTRAQVLAAAADVLADHGYEPRQDGGDVSMRNCPFHNLARQYTDLVCGMNVGLLGGVVEGLRLDGVEAILDPAPDRCCVRLVEREAGRAPLAQADRTAYRNRPETVDEFWADAETWGEQ